MTKTRILFAAGAVAALGLWIGACHDNKNPATPEHVHATAQVLLSQSSATLNVGDHVSLSAQPTCSCGEVLPSTVTWASDDKSVATVSAGVVTGVSFGTATITAASDGKSASATVTVEPNGTVVTALGGTVTSSDGAVVLDIPPGALTAATDITIEPAAAEEFEYEAQYVAGTGYVIKPLATMLQQAAHLQLRFEAANLPDGVFQEQLRIRLHEPFGGWQECDHLGLQGGRVAANIERFGVFGIVVQPAAGTYVGALGGTVLSSDGNVELTIPPGALDEPTDIVITKLDDAEFANEPLYVKGTAYEFGPDGLDFNTPVALQIHYEAANVPQGVDQTRLRIQQRDRVQNRWQECDHTGLQSNTVGANIQGFSTYAVVAQSGSQGGAVARVIVSPSSISLEEGDVAQLTADVQDASGTSLDVPVTWSVADPSVATVDATGRLTAISSGATSVTASAGGKQGGSTVTVSKKISTITVTGDASIRVGETTQLTATAYGPTGAVVTTTFTWASSAPAIAPVSTTGLVTGVAGGTADITASAKSASGSITITVSTTGGGGGGETEGYGNNLSWPIVFAEGTGIGGSPVSTDPGVRPGALDATAAAELAAIEFTSPSTPFFWSGNAVDGTGYYLQNTANTWRPQIVDGSGQSKYAADAAWGDNLIGTGNLSVGHPIRVEVALSATGIGTLQGYNMPYVANPSSPDEIQGTDGTLGSFTPLIYTVGPTLTIEKLSGPGGTVESTVSSGGISAEVNVGGRIVYGDLFKPTEAGTYRLRFILATGANVNITSAVNGIVVNSSESSIEINVTP